MGPIQGEVNKTLNLSTAAAYAFNKTLDNTAAMSQAHAESNEKAASDMAEGKNNLASESEEAVEKAKESLKKAEAESKADKTDKEKKKSLRLARKTLHDAEKAHEANEIARDEAFSVLAQRNEITRKVIRLNERGGIIGRLKASELAGAEVSPKPITEEAE